MIERQEPAQPKSVDSIVAEDKFEDSLRPRSFADYVGQSGLKKHLQLTIAAATKRGEPIDHVLLYGPPGLGKTTLAHVIARELNRNIKITSGPAVERAGDLASLLTNLEEGDILFIDEIHRLSKQVEEVLYPAMEDFAIDIMLGKGPAAQSVRLDLPKFTLVGATTRFGALSAPLRDRFGIIGKLEYYEPTEIAQIIKRNAKLLDIKIDDPTLAKMSERVRLTPRIANRLLRRVRDWAEVHGNGEVSDEALAATLELLNIDEFGLEQSDRKVLRTIIEQYGGGPVGVDTLAASAGEERQTIEDVYEPYLLQIGFLERTPRGRKATPRAFKHLNIKVEDQSANQSKLL
jgi:Holliday junction DNA helicase RuvB